MTLEQSAMGAVLPWNSADREELREFSVLPQQKIDICLLCPLHASCCEKCNGDRRVKAPAHRPRLDIDTEILRDMMRLRRTNKEMCAALGIGKSKLAEEKNKILKEDSK